LEARIGAQRIPHRITQRERDKPPLAKASFISDALLPALISVAAPSDVMNWARLFGHLRHRYRNYKSVRQRLNRKAGVISWFDTLSPNFFRKISSARQSYLCKRGLFASSSRKPVSFSPACTTNRSRSLVEIPGIAICLAERRNMVLRWFQNAFLGPVHDYLRFS
jgi:hypothetical protein